MCVCESMCCPPPIRMRRAGPLAKNPGGRTLPCFLGRNLLRILPDALSRRGSPFAPLWWRRCVPSPQSTTRPSEGPCCPLGQGCAGGGGSRIAGFLHFLSIMPISALLSLWHLLCTVTCAPVLGGVEVDNASRWIAIPPWKRHGTCGHRQRPLFTVHSTRSIRVHRMYFGAEIDRAITGQV